MTALPTAPARQVHLKVNLLEVLHGKFALITGPVGCGKSTLLSAILGEVPQLAGRIELLGSVAYCAQIPWLLHGTVQDNITFGKRYDEEKFSKVVDVCSLRPDLALLQDGQATIIGERGVNLSGGQKARVSLARAGYSDASLYLLDDPLSAVDAHVAVHLVKECLGADGFLSKTTRLLVSHQVQFATEVDLVVVIRNGEVTAVGPPQQFSIEELRSAERAVDEPPPESTQASGRPGVEGPSESGPPTLDRARSLPQAEALGPPLDRKGAGNQLSTKGFTRSTSAPPDPAEHEVHRRLSRVSSLDGEETGDTEERAEEVEEGALSLRVWGAFVKAMGWGVWVVIATNFVSTAGYLCSALWIGQWPEVSEKLGTADALVVYALISFAIVAFTAMRLLVFQYSSLKLSRSMHQRALWAVIRSPMSWHDTTPTGRVVNRFSSDLQKVDTDLQSNVTNLLRALFDMLASFLVVLFVVPLIFVVVIPSLIAYFWIQKIYRKSGREIQRMASKSYSPIYQGVDEAIAGVATIRAYEKQQYFSGRNAARISRSVRLDLTLQGCQRWLGFRLKMLGACISSMVALLVVLHSYLGPLGRSISGPAAGVALRYAQQLSNALESILNNLTSTEQCLVAVERLTTYSELEDEGSLETAESVPAVEGSVCFENVVMRYRPDLPTVLRGLSFAIPGGSSLGVVGRTGAGKSSLLQALFRMCPIESGTIHLYGKDVSGIGLHTLRKALAIIPQDPVGFTGTVRFNLDPFTQHDDQRLWQELEKVQLKAHFQAKEEGLDFQVSSGGENLSVGQRQLLCCARALIRGARILVLDEATASVDFNTDSLIQQVLRKEVQTKQLTTITIAHRISTILGADRVLVMEEGRAAEFGPTQELADTTSSKFAALIRAAKAAEQKTI